MKPKCEPVGKKRMCYCDSLDSEWKAARGYAPGFCGVCERCGKPGHTQHFPGPVPYTGAWCDRCVKIVAFTWIFRNPVFIFFCLFVVLYFIHRLFK